MALFKSGNPALSEKKFQSTVLDSVVDTQNSMTVKGTLNKFGFLMLMTVSAAFFTWGQFNKGVNVMPLMLTGIIGGLALAITMGFKKQWSPYLAPAYAILEGFFVGGISAFYENAFGAAGGYSGIVIQAIGLTFATVGAMYLLYKFNIIRATQKFKAIVLTATAGIGIFYLVCLGLYMFNVPLPGFMYENTALGIGFSVLVVALAALNLILDFDMIETGAAIGAPKFMEWYGAFGLLVTIVWLYIEILRLLAKLSSRD